MTKGGDRSSAAGFTIVEVMIVLAVSSALLISAATLISGRQAKTEFQTGINNVQQQLQQIINETSSGYYPNQDDFTCVGSVNGGVVKFNSTANGQGSNGGYQPGKAGCIFLGKAIQFGIGTDGDDPSTLAVLPIVGNQYYTPPLATDPEPISNLSQAVPRALYPASDTETGAPPKTALASTVMDYGLTIADSNHMCSSGAICFEKLTGSTTYPTGIAAIVAGDAQGNIAAQSNSGGLASGSQSFSLYAVQGSPPSAPNVSPETATSSIGNFASANGTGGLVAASVIYICVASATTNESGLFTIQGGSLNVTLDVKSGNRTCAD